jgi:hypothetical protein
VASWSLHGLIDSPGVGGRILRSLLVSVTFVWLALAACADQIE